MSVITPTITPIDQPGFGRVGVLVQWLLANGDSGVPHQMTGYADRSFQAEGTFGAGGTVVCEGSNDATNYRTLNDHFGAAASLTAAKLIGIAEVPQWVRPRCSAGDGTTAITVSMFLRRSQQ